VTATETPAQFLRRAAEQLHGLANAATPGPWRAEPGSRGTGSDGKPWPANYVASDKARPRFKVHSEADAAYIAAVDPGVALAIADMWDAVADEAEGYLVITIDDLEGDAVWTTTYNAARMLLGETEADAQ
jgi:hypothetical protein